MSLIASSKRLILGAGSTGQAVARHFEGLGIQFEVADTRQSDYLKTEKYFLILYSSNLLYLYLFSHLIANIGSQYLLFLSLILVENTVDCN